MLYSTGVKVSSAMSAGNRYPSGRRRPEHQPKHAGANIWAKRVHDGFQTMRRLGLSPEWGSVVGTLHLEGALTELEVQAAFVYCEAAARYDRYHPTNERTPRTVKSQAYQASFGGMDEFERSRLTGTITEYERRARRARKRWNSAVSAIDPGHMVALELPPDQERKIPPLPPRSARREIVDRVCLSDERVPDHLVPHLKEGLQRLAKALGLEVHHGNVAIENRQKLKTMDVKGRVALAIATLDRWFADDKATPTHFRLTRRERMIGVVVDGHKASGEKVSHTVLIRCHSRDLVEHIDALFLRACQAKCWKEITRTDAQSVQDQPGAT